MCPLAGGILGFEGQKSIVCHVLLVETAQGLVLIDAGLGLHDIAAPVDRLGRMFVGVCKPRLLPAEAAISHVRRLGYSPDDVRHVVLTHLDLDHVGGLSDFPKARAHVMAKEHEAATVRATMLERHRYRPAHVAFPTWSLYPTEGEAWHGFQGVRGMDGLSEEILLIPLIGHTHGHSGVAVQDDQGWLLHAGDSYFHQDEVRVGRAPFAVETFQKVLQMNGPARLQNRARLAELHASGSVRMFPAHDPVAFMNCGGVL